MIFGAILAGGIGSRMNVENMPKQFLPLGSKPIFIHTLEKFLMVPRIDVLYLGTHPQWVNYAQEILKKHDLADKVIVVPGGDDRNSTIINIVEHIRTNHGASPEHIIVTHDSVRPFVSVKIINDNIDAMQKAIACDTAIPAIDTIIESHDSENILNIPRRTNMYQGQTPQTFNVEKLYVAYQKLSEDELSSLTDACKIMLLCGHSVNIVAGSVSNIKLTTLMDYKIAQAIIESNENILQN